MRSVLESDGARRAVAKRAGKLCTQFFRRLQDPNRNRTVPLELEHVGRLVYANAVALAQIDVDSNPHGTPMLARTVPTRGILRARWVMLRDPKPRSAE